jgi:hypothetical protein
MRAVAAVVAGFALGVLAQRFNLVGEVLRLAGLRPYGRTVVFAHPSSAGLSVHEWSTTVGARSTLVFLVVGQSHAANFGERTKSTDSVWVFWDGRIHRVAEPVPGGEGFGGSVWPRFGSRIERMKNVNLLLIPVAIGGTKIQQWAGSGAFGRRLESTTELALRSGLTIDGTLVMLGEADAVARTSEKEWVASFRELSQKIRRAGVAGPILVATETRCFSQKVDSLIRRSQLAVVDGRQVFSGPDLDALGPEFRWDGCHFTSGGLDSLATLWTVAIDKTRRFP